MGIVEPQGGSGKAAVGAGDHVFAPDELGKAHDLVKRRLFELLPDNAVAVVNLDDLSEAVLDEGDRLERLVAGMLLLGIPLIMGPVIVLGRRVRGFSRSSQDKIAEVGSMVSETVWATFWPRNAPTKFMTAAMASATRGLRAPVDTDVAIALAASWKPLV